MTGGDTGLPEFRCLLEILGYSETSLISLASKARDDSFSPLSVNGIQTAAKLAESLIGDNVYFSVNEVVSGLSEGRGTAQDVHRVTALYADLDYKPNGLGSEETAREVIADLSQVLGVQPAATVLSGHGLQPYWVLDDLPNDAATRLVFRRFRALVDRTAARRGGCVDPVFDLARMLRVPGTTNKKDQKHPLPVTAEFAPEGQWHRLNLEEVQQALDRSGIGIGESDDDTDVVQSSSGSWPTAEVTCPYVAKMIEGWATDAPSIGRHQWMVAQAVRLAAALRRGCVSQTDLLKGLSTLDERLRHLCEGGIAGDPRTPPDTETYSAYAWAIQKVEKKSDDQVDEELGSHRHNAPESTGHADRVDWVIQHPLDELPGLMERLGDGPLAGFFVKQQKVWDTRCLPNNVYKPPADSAEGTELRMTTPGRLRLALQQGYDIRIPASGPGSPGLNYVPAMLKPQSIMDALSNPDACPNLRPLREVVRTPILLPDYTLVTRPGWHDQYLYLPTPGQRIEPIRLPEGESVQHIRHIFHQFPWTCPGDEFNWLTALLLPILLTATPESTAPLLLLHAHQPGSGKTLLAQTLLSLYGGEMLPFPKSEEEVVKTLTSSLSSPQGVVRVFDNIDDLSSRALEQLLTSHQWSSRLLGGNTISTLRNTKLWVATGNNCHVGKDMLRRTLWSSIDPKVARPEERTGYEIPNLNQWITQNKVSVLSHLYGLIIDWRDAGAPIPSNLAADSFPALDIATAILNFHGVEGSARDRSNQPVQRSTDDDALLEFICRLFDEYGEEPFSAKQLHAAAKGSEDLEHSIPGDYDPETGTPLSLGMILKKRVKRIVSDDECDWCIVNSGRSNKSDAPTRNANLYRVTRSPRNHNP